jgi:uncharacterized membrane protein YdjX (TVP38/TMEM64 family)
LLKKIHKKRVQRLIAYINLTVLIFLIVVVYYDYSNQGLTYWLSKNNLYEVKAYFETLTPLMSYFTACLLVLIEVVIGIIPGIIMYPILGFVLGAEKALIVIFTMGLLGNLINYYQGKTLMDAFIDKKKNAKLLEKLEYGGGLSLFLIRLNPLTSVDSVSYFAGAIDMKVTTFILATGLGTLPFIFAATIFGVEFLNLVKPYLELLIYITLGVVAYKVVKAKMQKNKK